MERHETTNDRILAVGAHPDDVEFLMAGTLTLLYQKGYKIYIATVATGDMGSMELRSQQISSKRYKEAVNAAKILDASYQCLGESDLSIVFDNPTRFKATELIRKVVPYIVFTLSPQDYMKDHELTADLMWDACFNASVPNYDTHQSNPACPTTSVPYLFYADPIEGMDRFGQIIQPEFYVDISSVMDTKEKMLSQHDSQRSWLRAQHGMDQYIINMKEWSAERGEEVGVKYAEGFRQHKGHPFSDDNILKKLLAEKLIQDTAELSIEISEYEMPEDLSVEIPEGGVSLERIERQYICVALKQTEGNVTKAAEILGISRRQLQGRMKSHNITREDFILV